MQKIQLGKTKINVSRVCFGTLTISHLQKNFDKKQAAKLLCSAIDRGINFFDTAQLYQTYDMLAQAIKYDKSIVVSTKSYAYDKKTAQESFEEARKKLGRDYIDIFMLHEQESIHTLKGHFEAIEYFVEQKQKGYIGAFGISTHFIAGVMAATDSKYSEYIDVIHSLYNVSAIGIIDGDFEKMQQSTKKAFDCGKGVFAMKPLGGGHLISQRKKALDFVINSNIIHSFAIGLQCCQEIEYICELVEQNENKSNNFDKIQELEKQLQTRNRKLIIHDWCSACACCVSKCKSGAIEIKNKKAVVDEKKCTLCSYCASACSEFCIKII